MVIFTILAYVQDTTLGCGEGGRGRRTCGEERTGIRKSKRRLGLAKKREVFIFGEKNGYNLFGRVIQTVKQ